MVVIGCFTYLLEIENNSFLDLHFFKYGVYYK